MEVPLLSLCSRGSGVAMALYCFGISAEIIAVFLSAIQLFFIRFIDGHLNSLSDGLRLWFSPFGRLIESIG